MCDKDNEEITNNLYLLIQQQETTMLKLEASYSALEAKLQPLTPLGCGSVLSSSEKEKLSGEITVLQRKLNEAIADREVLSRAVTVAAKEAGVAMSNWTLTVPQLVMLCRELSSEVIRLKAGHGFNTSA